MPTLAHSLSHTLNRRFCRWQTQKKQLNVVTPLPPLRNLQGVGFARQSNFKGKTFSPCHMLSDGLQRQPPLSLRNIPCSKKSSMPTRVPPTRYTTNREYPIPPPFSTRICAGMRSFSASTWLMMPIILPLAFSVNTTLGSGLAIKHFGANTEHHLHKIQLTPSNPEHRPLSPCTALFSPSAKKA